MEETLAEARDAVEAATELTDDATAREQLHSIREGLDALSGEQEPDDAYSQAEEPDSAATRGDRLEELERQLVELGDDVDGLAVKQIETARDRIDAFRRERAQDW